MDIPAAVTRMAIIIVTAMPEENGVIMAGRPSNTTTNPQTVPILDELLTASADSFITVAFRSVSMCYFLLVRICH